MNFDGKLLWSEDPQTKLRITNSAGNRECPACGEIFPANLLHVCSGDDISDEVYLPIDCPVCNRRRLLFYRGSVHCEKCGVDTDTINYVLKLAYDSKRRGNSEQ